MSINKPKVSVIVPVYNVEKYIARCIESVLNQSFTDFELLLIDDCSQDKSIEIAQTYVEQDSRVKILRHKENVGQGLARQTGYEAADGDWITFLDSDDELPKEALSLLVEVGVKKDADIVIGNYEIVGEKGRTTRENKSSYGYTNNGLMKTMLKRKMPTALWARLYNRRLFEGKKYKNYKDHAPGQDAVLAYQILMRNSPLKIEKIESLLPVYCYRINSASETNRKKTARQFNGIALTARIMNQLFCNSEFEKDCNRSIYHTILAQKLKGYSKEKLYPAFKKYDIDTYFRYKTIANNYNFICSALLWFLINHWSIKLLRRN